MRLFGARPQPRSARRACRSPRRPRVRRARSRGFPSAHEQHEAAVLPPAMQYGSLVEAPNYLGDRPRPIEPAWEVIDAEEAGLFEGGKRSSDVLPSLPRGVQDADPLEMNRLRQPTLCVEQSGARQRIHVLGTLKLDGTGARVGTDIGHRKA